MELITKTFYRATDGKEFETETECVEYEQKQKEVKSLLRAAKRIKQICQIYTDYNDTNCKGCPFDDKCPFRMKRLPYYWEVKVEE